MTFIPQVLSKNDNDNSYPGNMTYNTAVFTGNSSDTTGYNSLIINIVSNYDSQMCGLKIQFSSTGTDFDSQPNLVTYYTNTIFCSNFGSSGNTFTKTYPICKRYYRIVYTSSVDDAQATVISSRLRTQAYTNPTASIGAFINSQENIYDAFGKLRVTEPYTILNLRVPGQDGATGAVGSTNYLQNDIQICSKSTGVGATKTYSNAVVNINVTGNYTYTNQSRKYCVYQPGKSLLIMATGVMNASNNTSGMKSRIGLFDDYNGLFYEYDSANNCSICLRSSSVTTTVNQVDWNINKMDGTGEDPIILNWTKAQLIIIDMEWLGVGRVRFGFYVFGKIIYCHEITNINSLTAPYIKNINLPIRYELVGVTGGSGSLTQICSTVISEGGYEPAGRPFSVGVSGSGIAVTTGSETPLIAIRGGNTLGNYYHQNILPTGINILSTGSNDYCLYYLRMYLPPNGSTGITWTDVNTNYSIVQYATSSLGGLTTSNSIIVTQGYFLGATIATFSKLDTIFSELLQITSDIDNESSILVLSCTRLTGTGSNDVFASLSWQEIY